MNLGELLGALNRLVEAGVPLDAPIRATPSIVGVEVYDDDPDGPYVMLDHDFFAERDE